ncbi:FKBP-type peptidyl-prolyl cis-trans isomerase [bacterium]|nr:FKBP-type peptidyl-prolyl cis-trans isomerase [bacterium]
MKRAALAALLALLLAGCPDGSSGTSTGKPGEIAVIATLVTLGPTAVTTPSGLRYEDKVVGEGASPKQGQRCYVHYTGWLTNGKVFDTSKNRGAPFDFSIGYREVITGWDEGVATMKPRGVRRLVIPPALGYGTAGQPPGIPGNATLVFDIELLEVR